jgi:hypothetical protein
MKYQIPSECMGFKIQKVGEYLGNPKFVTQEFSYKGSNYQISLIADYKHEMHAYDADEVSDDKVPVEVATLRDGECFDIMDNPYIVIKSDLELGKFLHKWVKSIRDFA